jgi:hypothetical protein
MTVVLPPDLPPEEEIEREVAALSGAEPVRPDWARVEPPEGAREAVASPRERPASRYG